ncbi:MAG: hypothetical protein LBG52_06735 [Candidatus Peribacteria bacterium]|nr:hypothetical protein [Candidatus Peribacteria bacterium]
MVYSTCTTNVIENEGVIASILETLGDSIELLNVEIEEKSKGIPNPIIYNDTTPPTSHLSRDALMVHPNINKTDTNKTTPPTSRLNETDR